MKTISRINLLGWSLQFHVDQAKAMRASSYLGIFNWSFHPIVPVRRTQASSFGMLKQDMHVGFGHSEFVFSCHEPLHKKPPNVFSDCPC